MRDNQSMQLNAQFIRNIEDLYGAQGTVWIKALPKMLAELCDKYHLRFQQSFSNLTYHFVAIVEQQKTQQSAILKIAPVDHNHMQEARWLQSFDEGVPKIFWIDESYHAYLMEQVLPGKSLASYAQIDDEEATRIVCRTIKNLQTHQTAQLACKPLSELGKAFAVLKNIIAPQIRSKAESLFQTLTSTGHCVLLHGDLHHDNILSSGDTWKVIDPHGYVGDPVFEIGPMIYNPKEAFPAHLPLSQIIDTRFNIITEELDFDAQRIKAWAFCMSILSIAWTVEDHGTVPAFELEVANILNKKI